LHLHGSLALLGGEGETLIALEGALLEISRNACASENLSGLLGIPARTALRFAKVRMPKGDIQTQKAHSLADGTNGFSYA
jgi:hypothetical protein